MKCTLILLSALLIAGTATLDAQTLKGWTKGKGFGWVWGRDDQIGALNAILSPERTLKAFQSIKKGKVYDLGVPLDRHSYKWPGHSATSIMSFRSPPGVKLQGDVDVFVKHPKKRFFRGIYG